MRRISWNIIFNCFYYWDEFENFSDGIFLGKHTYLRDSWNVLDFIVVVVGWISVLVGGNNISALRTIRILRPLRTINYLKGMRILVRSIINSLPNLCDILVFFAFLLLVFGLIGLQLFQGLYR